MALIKCSRCGHDISDKARKCPHCNTENTGQPGAPIPERNPSTNKTMVVAVILLALAAVVVMLAFFTGRGKNDGAVASADTDTVMTATCDSAAPEPAVDTAPYDPTAHVAAEAEPAKKADRYFYVVVASYTSLAEAREFNNNGPCDIEYGNVYKAQKDGQTLYRVCSGCYPTKAAAKRAVKEEMSFLRQIGSDITPWIWASPEAEVCVDRPIGANDRYLTGFCDLE